jgi:hypothetical protein
MHESDLYMPRFQAKRVRMDRATAGYSARLLGMKDQTKANFVVLFTSLNLKAVLNIIRLHICCYPHLLPSKNNGLSFFLRFPSIFVIDHIRMP